MHKKRFLQDGLLYITFFYMDKSELKPGQLHIKNN